MQKRPTVLIVESRQSARTFLEMTLQQEGVRVFSAVSLDSALLQLRVLQPDLIIVALDALALFRDEAITQLKMLSEAPVLGLVDEHDRTPRPGVTDTLTYPIKAGQLCGIVAGLLHER